MATASTLVAAGGGGMVERELPTYPTWERYTVLSHVISNLPVKDRRQIFLLVRRHAPAPHDLFFPAYGFTLAEFATWHVICESRRYKKKKKKKTTARTTSWSGR